ncbi:MAG: FG-GAP-like repeat-containing protein [Planctomycetota bacterium]
MSAANESNRRPIALCWIVAGTLLLSGGEIARANWMFVRGDANGDGVIQINDPIVVLSFLFQGGPGFCLDAMDAADSGLVDIGDAIYILSYLFSAGTSPLEPFPACGQDPTADAIGCAGPVASCPPGPCRFAPPVAYGAGNFTLSLALGDVDGDGDLDVLTANSFPSNGVSMFLGDGDGTLAPVVHYQVGGNPQSIKLGDIDADGDLDAVLANSGFLSVNLLLGNNDGTFAASGSYDAGAGSHYAALGDVDGDGDLDVVAANSISADSGSVSVVSNFGDGTFAAPVQHAVESNPQTVTLGDVNGDGDLDALTANTGLFSVGDTPGSTVSILLGNGDGTLAAQSILEVGLRPRSATLGDVDGDGDVDVLATNTGEFSYSPMPGETPGTTVSLLSGNGDGTFATQVTQTVGNAPHSVALGDVDGDGSLDAVTANYSSNSASFLFGNGDGTFASHVQYAAGTTPIDVALGDLDGDGDLDALTTTFLIFLAPSTVTVLLNECF